MMKLMSEKPTAADFLRALWDWLKRNYHNIALTIIIFILLFIADYTYEAWVKLNSINATTETYLPSLFEDLNELNKNFN
jgi:hypothetical protein